MIQHLPEFFCAAMAIAGFSKKNNAALWMGIICSLICSLRPEFDRIRVEMLHFLQQLNNRMVECAKN